MHVTVLRGPEPALWLHATTGGEPPGTLWLAQPPERLRSLGAFRTLLAQLRRRLGDPAIEEVLARHAPAAALFLPGRRGGLAGDEEATARALSARPASHMTHNFILQHPIFEHWAGMFVDLLELAAAPLVAPSLGLLSWEDSALLKSIYRRFLERAPDLVLGFDPFYRPEEIGDGLVRGLPADKALALALDFQALQEGEPTDLAAPESPVSWEETVGPRLRDLADDPDDLEARAFEELAAPRPWSSEVVERAVAALRRGFESFAFTSIVQLGQTLLAGEPALTPREAADVHTLLSLAAHNRQFLTQGNRPLAEFLSRHLERALALEDRPERRAALLYRLAVARGRRLRDLDVALAWADQAVAAVRHPDLSSWDAAYQEAWAHNIRAYVLMQRKDLDGAREATIAGFGRIDELFAATLGEHADQSPPPDRDAVEVLDLRATHSLLAFNTRTLLALLERDTTDVAAWLERSRVAIRAVPAIERFEAFAWADLYEKTHRPDLALPIVLRGLENARREVDAMREYEHALTAADLAYRLGDAATVREQGTRVQEIRRRCGLLRLPAIDVLAALAALRAGDFAAARAGLTATLADPAHQGDDARATLLGLRAWAAAGLGDGEAVEADLDEAIDLAVGSGERDTLLRVTVAAARCAVQLGSPEEARATFAQAVEIAAQGADAPAAEHIAALVGAADEDERASLLEALALAARSLGDADVWWELAPLLAALAARLDEPEIQADLAPVAAAARRRGTHAH